MRLVLAIVLAGLVGFPQGLSAQAKEYEAVETDTSDDAFLIIVTKKYEGGKLTGATVLIKHKESGRYAIPYVDAVEIDTLDQVIREHKAKLLRAQVGEQVEASEPDVVEAAPSSEPAPEEPALQLKLDAAGLDVTPSPPRTFNGYTLEELELRKRRAAFGLIAPAALIIAGVPPLVVGTTGDCRGSGAERCFRLQSAGMALMAVGGLGMIAISALVGVRKANLKRPVHDYTLEELELRVWRTKIGLGVSGGALVLGVALLLAGTLAGDCWEWDAPTKCDVLPIVGGTLMIGGLVGVVVSSVLNAQAQRRKPRGEHHRKPRRVQWDLERSRLVF